MVIVMFDGLHQAHRFGNHPAATSRTALTWDRLAIGSLEDSRIAVPSITKPGERAMMGALDGGGHGLGNQSLVLRKRAGGTREDEATLAVDHQASPALSGVRFLGGAFFCTNDQNSSISTG